jgi:hypothetical protein
LGGDIRLDPKMKLRLVEDYPATWTTVTAVEWPRELSAEYRRGPRMRHRRPGLGVQHAVYNLRHDVLGHREQIVVGGASLRGSAHCKKR